MMMVNFKRFFTFILVLISASVLSETETQILDRYGLSLGNNNIKNQIASMVANETICSNSGQLINSPSGPKSIYSFDSILNELKPQINKMTEACGSDFGNDYLKYRSRFGNISGDPYCLNNDCAKTIDKLHNSSVANLLNAIALTSPNRIRKPVKSTNSSEIRINQRLCQEAAPDNIISSTNAELVEITKQVSHCTPLAPNEVRVINPTRDDMRSYSITNHGPKGHELTFNINFKSPTNNSQDESKLLDRVKSCLNEVNKNSIAPDGKPFKISVVGSNEVRSAPSNNIPKPTDIIVGKEGFRSMAGKFSKDISCEAIVHELLHHTGLQDEYPENQYGMYFDKHIADKSERNSQAIFHYHATESQKSNPSRWEFKPHANHCRAISKSRPSVMGLGMNRVTQKLISKHRLCECAQNISNAKCSTIINESKEIQDLKIKLSDRVRYAHSEQFKKYCKTMPQTFADYDQRSIINSLEEIKAIKHIASFSRTTSAVTLETNRYNPGHPNHSSLGFTTKQKTNCSCPAGEPECQSFLKTLESYSADESSIPASVICLPGMQFKKLMDTHDLKNAVTSSRQIILSNFPEKKKSQLLRKAHFTQVLFPKCDHKASRIKECGKYAMIDANKECPNRPTYCSDESQWLDISD